jgi:D-xylose transport system substrate-binding protein
LRSLTKRAARTACAGGAALVLAACSVVSSTPVFVPPESTSPPGLHFSLSKVINYNFSAMSALKPLAALGRASIAAILPADATAGHFKQFDMPYLKSSFRTAGLTPAQYTVQLTQGSQQFHAVRQAIGSGAKVLVVDTRYSGAGGQIESYAKAHGVPVIDYDYLTLGGTPQYYVGFDSLKIGVLLGQGLVSCVSAWKVKHPRVIVMRGASDDYNSALYAEGYDAVLAKHFSAGWKDVSNPPGTWDPLVARSEFKQQYAAHKKINAALIPNDENARPIITYLRHLGTKAWTFPATGLDATLTALQRILAGYQCGTVYKPIRLEAQAAAALAMYVWAGVKRPASLVNWSVTDPQTNRPVPSVLLTPEWVTRHNMKSTTIKDGFVKQPVLCDGYTAACSADGIGSASG